MRYLILFLILQSDVIAGESVGSTAPWLGLPFGGLLLSIALMPLWMPTFWHRHSNKVAGFWGGLVIMVWLGEIGVSRTFDALVQVMLHHYVPFIILISALFIMSGGIHIVLRARGRPWVNTIFLLLGSLCANLIGTTGAAMLLVRPFIRMNAYRRYKAHLIVFFIFTVCNIGGSLTPIGDPPLFLGFLEGVPFLWPLIHVGPVFLMLMMLLLAVFWGVDQWLFRHDRQALIHEQEDAVSRFTIQGKKNLGWLLAVIFLVIVSGLWINAPQLWGISLASLVRDVGILMVTWASKKFTSPHIYEANHFSYSPLKEVAVLFAAIFITITPLVKELQAGCDGHFSALHALLNPGGQPANLLYFWVTGFLSSFLDNAPTYLVFFHMTGCGIEQLVAPLAPTLVAISAGAVFMGAMTYIGNAPNFMVRSLAEQAHIRMPSFFGYMLWSCGILLPLLILVSWIMWG